MTYSKVNADAAVAFDDGDTINSTTDDNDFIDSCTAFSPGHITGFFEKPTI